jgi:N-acetylmuramoyl-L-alanine amidase
VLKNKNLASVIYEWMFIRNDADGAKLTYAQKILF